MTTSEITYEQLFPNPYVQFGNIRFAIKIILQEGDAVADAFTKGHKEANENFNRLFPQVAVNPEHVNFYPPNGTGDPIYQHEPATPTALPEIQIQKSRVEVLIQDIERCKSLNGANGLLSWKLLVSKNPELQPAFDKKMEQLNQQNL